jgi:hypothetical protein
VDTGDRGDHSGSAPGSPSGGAAVDVGGGGDDNDWSAVGDGGDGVGIWDSDNGQQFNN